MIMAGTCINKKNRRTKRGDIIAANHKHLSQNKPSYFLGAAGAGTGAGAGAPFFA